MPCWSRKGKGCGKDGKHCGFRQYLSRPADIPCLAANLAHREPPDGGDRQQRGDQCHHRGLPGQREPGAEPGCQSADGDGQQAGLAAWLAGQDGQSIAACRPCRGQQIHHECPRKGGRARHENEDSECWQAEQLRQQHGTCRNGHHQCQSSVSADVTIFHDAQPVFPGGAASEAIGQVG